MLLIGNVIVITRDPGNPFLRDGCVAADVDIISGVGETGAMRTRYPDSRFIDARGGLIMPGFINAHMHYYSAFSRGFPGKGEGGRNFIEVLERLWWRLDKALAPDDVYYSALVCMADCIKNGTTTVIDHHASPNAVRGSLCRIADAARESGVRSCLCYEVSDRDGPEIARQGIAENAEFIKYAAGDKSGLISGTFGLHASMTLSDATLEACAEANGAGAGFHVHVAEDSIDEDDAIRRHGKRAVERFRDFGMLGRRSIAIHCVHVNEGEKEILRETGTAVVMNPESNMGNAVGCCPAPDMLSRGILVGLGTDGYVSDMLQSFKMANAILKHDSKRPDTAWAEVPEMLFHNNAVIAGRYFSTPVGRLAPGCSADVIVCSYSPPTEIDGGNINGHLLFGASGRSVTATVARGRVLMEDGKLTELDEAEIYAKAREHSKKVWERF
jgi:putative selenium metabolism protein SsnA